MTRLRLFRTLSCAGLLLAGVFGLIHSAAQAQSTPEVMETATEAAHLPIYRVTFLEENDVLNIRAGPGVQYPIVSTLENGDETQATGEEQSVGDSLWVPVESLYGPSFKGWMNRLYAVKELDPAIFCADKDAEALVMEVRAAIREQDGERLAQTILPARGLYLTGLDWSQPVQLSEADVRNFFTDTTVRDWGTGMYDPTPITGTIPDLVMPLMASDMLPRKATIACDDMQAGGMYPTVYFSHMDTLPFYSVMRPGARGHELDWGAWALGIDDWGGTPVLTYLAHYFWTP